MREIREAFYEAGAEVPAREQFVFPECTPGLLLERVCLGEGIGFIGSASVGFVEGKGVVLPVSPNPFAMRLSVVTRRPLDPGSPAALLRDYLLRLFDSLPAPLGPPEGRLPKLAAGS